MFSLADEKFCIPLSFVEAIEHAASVTPVPKARYHIAGLVNMRGNIIAVVDMAKLLKLDKAVSMNKFILINDHKQSTAIIADDVDDVVDVQEGDIENVAMDGEKISIVKYQDIIATLITEKELSQI